MKIDESDIICITDSFIDISINEKYFKLIKNKNGLHAYLLDGALSHEKYIFTLRDSQVIEVDYHVKKNILTGNENVILRFFKGKL